MLILQSSGLIFRGKKSPARRLLSLSRKPYVRTRSRETMVRILLVDDEPVIHELVGRFLRHYEFEVLDADHGIAALEILQERSVDLVVADIRMPRMDGLLLLEKVRESWPDLPVIMVSGHGDDETEARAFELGANAFMPKPLRLAKLVETITEQLSAVGAD